MGGRGVNEYYLDEVMRDHKVPQSGINALTEKHNLVSLRSPVVDIVLMMSLEK